MRIFDENDVEITLDDVDYEKGRLITDYKLIQFHPAVPHQYEEGHTRIVVHFTDGTSANFDDGYPPEYFDAFLEFQCVGEYEDKEFESIEQVYVVDKEAKQGSDAWYENEEIQRYVLYTPEELEENRLIKERNDEIMRQEAIKRDEYQNVLIMSDAMVLTLAEDLGAYSDTELQVDDLTLAMADVIGG